MFYVTLCMFNVFRDSQGPVYAIQDFHNAWWCFPFNQNKYLLVVIHFQQPKACVTYF